MSRAVTAYATHINRENRERRLQPAALSRPSYYIDVPGFAGMTNEKMVVRI